MKVNYEREAWVDLSADDDVVRVARDSVSQRLTAMLGATRLIVLAGLGTSLAIGGGAAGAPSMQSLWDEASKLDGFDDAVVWSAEAKESKNLEMLLSRCQMATILGSEGGVPGFLKAAEAMIVEKCRFVHDDTQLATHMLFLRKVARRSTRHARTQIFTTNYDLAFEAAADRSGFHLVDGFGLGKSRRFDGTQFDLDFVRRAGGERPILEPNVAQFFKLHGSVDWRPTANGIVRDESAETPLLIFPTQDKFRLSYESPYLECIARFQMALRERDVAVVVVGFGFNDAHITAPLRSAVESNVGLRVAVVMPEADTSQNLEVTYLRDLVRLGDRRITMFAGTFDEFTELLPDLAPEDERDVHLRRLSEARTAPES